MFSNKTLIVFSLIFSFLSVSAKSDVSGNLTAYEMLEKFNFPRGILPLGVKSYVLNDDGSFQVHFDGSCKFQLEDGYSLSYKNTITGQVGLGSLKNLKGISVKVLFIWLSITEVDRADEQLEFYVGPLSASFPLSNFEECPQCGCGLDCVTMISDS